MTTLAEQWRPVPSVAGYEVSDLGRVRSYRRHWRGSSPYRMICIRIDRNGYECVRLTLPEGRRTVDRKVHSLVVEAFIGPRPDGMVTRHLNGVKSDNRLTNLRYGTPLENNLDTVQHGGHPAQAKTHCPAGHPYAGDNLIWATNANGRPKRVCRECQRATWRRSNWKRRAVA